MGVAEAFVCGFVGDETELVFVAAFVVWSVIGVPASGGVAPGVAQLRAGCGGRESEEAEGVGFGELSGALSDALADFGALPGRGVFPEEVPVPGVGEEGAEPGSDRGEHAGKRLAAESEERVDDESGGGGGGAGGAGSLSSLGPSAVGEQRWDVFLPDVLEETAEGVVAGRGLFADCAFAWHVYSGLSVCGLMAASAGLRCQPAI